MSGIVDNMREKLGKFIYVYMWLFILLFITAIVIYYRWEIRKEHTNSKKMEDMYNKIYEKKIEDSIDTSDQNFKFPLVDYYIKSSYNSCCAGNFYNSYVTLMALEVLIGLERCVSKNATTLTQ